MKLMVICHILLTGESFKNLVEKKNLLKALTIDGFFPIKLPLANGVKELLQNYLSSAEINVLFTTREIWQESSLSLGSQLINSRPKWNITVKRSLVPCGLACDPRQDQALRHSRTTPQRSSQPGSSARS